MAVSERPNQLSSIDFLTPIHKALRLMIYDVGSRLQTTDFSDSAESQLVLNELIYEFSSALSASCILCLLHSHAKAEDLYLFPAVEKSDSKLITDLLQEHHGFATELRDISTMCDELKGVASAQRIARGKQLTLAVNDFFARYLTHLVREEKELIPLMNRYLTDDQLMSIRDAMSGHLSPDRFTGFMKWMLASLNPTELAKMSIEVTSKAPDVPAEVSARATASSGPDRSGFEKVAATSEIPSGSMKQVGVGGIDVMLANVNGAFYALSNKCTHAGGPLAKGKLEGFVVQCPLHGSKFDVRTGAVVGPPAQIPERVFGVKVEGKDVLVNVD
jgi:nitrite reductase/ring-hydroxylating ferredoxin subunit/iron-sulfur cluster repair protein YtfE (RIC family)